jgi:hypothetical protein
VLFRVDFFCGNHHRRAHGFFPNSRTWFFYQGLSLRPSNFVGPLISVNQRTGDENLSGRFSAAGGLLPDIRIRTAEKQQPVCRANLRDHYYPIMFKVISDEKIEARAK